MRPSNDGGICGERGVWLGRLINIGYGNMVNFDKIVSVVSPESAPVKRMVQNARDRGTAIDATQGRKTQGVIITDSDYLILSALLPETIAGRCREEAWNPRKTFVQEDVP